MTFSLPSPSCDLASFCLQSPATFPFPVTTCAELSQASSTQTLLHSHLPRLLLLPSNFHSGNSHISPFHPVSQCPTLTRPNQPRLFPILAQLSSTALTPFCSRVTFNRTATFHSQPPLPVAHALSQPSSSASSQTLTNPTHFLSYTTSSL